ncbi:MAG TPA: response regulator [Bryobacteraceae bacterium]|jgi:two-component system response regulator RegA|nr:response regulator [Bryobacteraceae bacterium]
MPRPKKVLIVDDEPEQLTLRCMLIARQGLTSLPAEGPRAALALAEAERPNCALMDLRLPTVQSGLRLIRDLRRLDPAMKIVVLTGQAMALETAPEMAMVAAVFEKGGSSKKLLEAIRTLCQ